MKNISLSVLACIMLAFSFTSCESLAGLADRAEGLDSRIEQAQDALDAFGPLAEQLGPEMRERHAALVAMAAESRELLTQATAVHQSAMNQATDPNTGDVDWLQYALLALAGGGGLLARKTGKDNARVHQRVDEKTDRMASIEIQIRELHHAAEVERARREQPPAS